MSNDKKKDKANTTPQEKREWEEEFEKEFPEICLQSCHPKDRKDLYAFITKVEDQAYDRGYTVGKQAYFDEDQPIAFAAGLAKGRAEKDSLYSVINVLDDDIDICAECKHEALTAFDKARKEQEGKV